MEESSLFSSSKWSIISVLGRGPSSPMEMAAELKTSMANISQQLRILEAYGLVTKQRTKAYGPGKPRTLYRISATRAFIALASPTAPMKAMVELGPAEEFQMRIWGVSSGKLRRMLSSWAGHLSSYLKHIHYIGIDLDAHDRLFLVVGTAYVGHVKNACERALSKHNTEHRMRFHVVSHLRWQEHRKSDQPYETGRLQTLHRLSSFRMVKNND